MPNKPILLFPTASSVDRYKKKKNVLSNLKHPALERQEQRLGPKMDVLEEAFNSQRVLLDSEASGIEPEMVLVFETRGTIDSFYKALKNIPDMEWLGELESEFESDDDFYIEDKEEKNIRGRVFFIFSNYAALQELLSLWNNFYKTSTKFPHSKGKWRDLFNLLYDIRPWGLKDRIHETGLIEDWNYRIEGGQQIIPFEIELWYRKPEQRAQARNRIESLLAEVGGILIQETIIEEIQYHGILANAPLNIFNNIAQDDAVSLLLAEDIMFIRPVAQFAVSHNLENIEPFDAQPAPVEPIAEIPRIALLDGYPIANHQLLADYLIIDDPDNYSADCPADKRMHGTAMASLILRGDLNNPTPPLKQKVYCRPILKNRLGTNDEYLPDDTLAIDLIHRAVKRLFEGENGGDPVASQIKIINLSIGDPARVFSTTMSSLAKLIDWLAHKYNVLFLISAGNCVDELVLDHERGRIDELKAAPQIFVQKTIQSLFNNIRFRKIISPAESINAITIGASHNNAQVGYQIGHRINPINDDLITSPISRMGLGYKRAIKPDVLMPGGIKLYDEKLGNMHENVVLKVNQHHTPPGIKVASPSTDGSLNYTIYAWGTSNANALGTRLGGQLLEMIDETVELKQIPTEYIAVLLKSLMVHGASWSPQAMDIISNSLPPAIKPKNVISGFMGYGNIGAERILSCTDQRATLLGWGELNAEEAHLYKLPLPIGITGQVVWRRLTVTLAWLTPVSCLNQKYRQAALWFDFPGNNESILNVARKQADHNAVRRGTIQHEIFEGNNASAFVDGTNLEIRINCREDAEKLKSAVRYSLSVTIEVAEGVDIHIYDEIRERVIPEVIINQ